MTEASGLRISGIEKEFPGVTALADVSLHVREGEFVTLLGPSGCGKTTLLRIIAGFESATKGVVSLDGREITALPPHRRPVNTVFQRPVLLPHLNVFENVAFGLRAKRLPSSEVRKRVKEILEVVRLPGFDVRRSDELSGGQAQRISLARALVNQPRVLLLDEPLSALDLQVRFDMQAELKRIHQDTGITFLYVTHDQQEAMAMSDRVAVMDQGRVRQIGAPREIYHAPTSSFVARFVGNANVLPVAVDDGEKRRYARLVGGDTQILVTHVPPGVRKGWICMRPETLQLGDPVGADIIGIVSDVSFFGAGVQWRVAVGDHEVRVIGDGGEANRYERGETVGIAYDYERVRFLDD